MTPNSYDVATSHRDIGSEIERIRIQAQWSWRKELRNLVRFGLRDGFSVLDVGCGPGCLSSQLLTSFPHIRVTAVEVDDRLAKYARCDLAQNWFERVHVINASILNSGLEENSFDFAVARLVFQHLPQPEDAAREIFRLLRPGGKLAVIDSDDAIWGLSDPAIPQMGAVLDSYDRLQRAHGGNRLVGRQLWRTLNRSGYINLDTDAVIVHSDELGLEAFALQLDPDRLRPMCHAGLLSKQQIHQFESSCEHLFASPAAIVIMVLLMACGEKPKNTSRSGNQKSLR